MVPFNSDGSKVVKYIAADRDKKSVKIIEAYSAWLGDGRLIGVNWDLKEGWQELFKKQVLNHRFGLIMKVVPVVKGSSVNC